MQSQEDINQISLKPVKNHAIDTLFEETPLNRQVKRAELILSAVVATKCLSFSVIFVLGLIITKIFLDSKNAKKEYQYCILYKRKSCHKKIYLFTI